MESANAIRVMNEVGKEHYFKSKKLIIKMLAQISNGEGPTLFQILAQNYLKEYGTNLNKDKVFANEIDVTHDVNRTGQFYVQLKYEYKVVRKMIKDEFEEAMRKSTLKLPGENSISSQYSTSAKDKQKSVQSKKFLVPESFGSPEKEEILPSKKMPPSSTASKKLRIDGIENISNNRYKAQSNGIFSKLPDFDKSKAETEVQYTSAGKGEYTDEESKEYVETKALEKRMPIQPKRVLVPEISGSPEKENIPPPKKMPPSSKNLRFDGIENISNDFERGICSKLPDKSKANTEVKYISDSNEEYTDEENRENVETKALEKKKPISLSSNPTLNETKKTNVRNVKDSCAENMLVAGFGEEPVEKMPMAKAEAEVIRNSKKEQGNGELYNDKVQLTLKLAILELNQSKLDSKEKFEIANEIKKLIDNRINERQIMMNGHQRTSVASRVVPSHRLPTNGRPAPPNRSGARIRMNSQSKD